MRVQEGADNDEVVIRGFAMSDLPGVTALWRRAGLPHRPLGRDRPERVAIEVEGDSAVFLVAEVAGKLVGVVFGTHDGRRGWINRLAVDPAYRRRGIAKILVHEVEQRLEGRGIDITAALVFTQNEASLRFLESIGYVHSADVKYLSKRKSDDI